MWVMIGILWLFCGVLLMTKNDKDEFVKRALLRLVVMILLIGLLVAAAFFVGAGYACVNGGGSLALDGYRCIDINVVDACEYDGVYYPVEGLNLSDGFV